MILIQNQDASLEPMKQTKRVPSGKPVLSSARRRGAFTLIEVLVVVAIIALLVAILLPSLSAARDQARTVVCASNMRQIGLSLAQYTTANNSWMPGPNTTGKELQYSSYSFGNSPSEPVQNMDWVSPLLGRVLNFSGDRKNRIIGTFSGELRCPSNDVFFDEEYTGGGAGVFSPSEITSVPYTSYSAMLGFHASGLTPAYWQGTASFPIPALALEYTLTYPRGYTMRIDKVGTESAKIAFMEGARFWDNGPRKTTFNSFVKQIQGGNYMNFGPSIAKPPLSAGTDDPAIAYDGGGTPYEFYDNFTTTTDARRLAFRHRDKINSVFFDNHVEALRPKETLDIGLYFPSGTIIDNADLTVDPKDTDGQVIY